MTDSLEDLKSRFRLPGLSFEVGPGGLPRIVIQTPFATAQIYLHGAHVTSYQPTGHDDLLFLSAKSYYRDDKAIRGGIPICLPWFGAKPDNAAAPMHGLARCKPWTLQSAGAADNGSIQLTLGFTTDADVRRWFPYDFSATYTVSVGPTLRLTLDVHNTGTESFTFTEALHTYLRVAGARSSTITGLEATDYLDKTQNFQQFNQGAHAIAFTAETDRVYLNTRATTTLHDPAGGRSISVAKDNSLSTVVWNPWAEKAAALPDFGKDEWQNMICIETANTGPAAVTLPPGQSHAMTAVLRSDSTNS